MHECDLGGCRCLSGTLESAEEDVQLSLPEGKLLSCATHDSNQLVVDHLDELLRRD